MNASLRCAFFLAALGASATATEPAVHVAASRGLGLAVIDAGRASPARDAVHQAFAASLGAALSRQCGAAVGVRAKCVGADYAAFNLGTGVYDAVLVIGRDVPDALRRVEGLTLSATPESGRRDRALHLIVGNGDAKLQSLLAAAFAGALADEKFLELFTGAADRVASAAAGAKVAAAGP